MATKECAKCKQTKMTDDFRIQTDKRYNTTRLCSWCKDCERQRALLRYNGNKQECQKQNKVYKETNKERIKEQRQKYLQENKDHVKQRYKTYCENNREKINQIARDYSKNNPHVQIKKTLNNRLRECLIKNKRTEQYLGTSIDVVMKWLEFNFGDIYTWENRGFEWHIDHTIPAQLFNMNNSEHVNLCFSWMNLMPLEKIKNIKKSNSIFHLRVLHQERQLRLFAKLHNLDHEVMPYIQKYAKYYGQLLAMQHDQIAGTPLEL